MQNTLTETLTSPVVADYDVVVVGGGVGGVGAALAAARCGKRVLVIEKGVFLGGLATLEKAQVHFYRHKK